MIGDSFQVYNGETIKIKGEKRNHLTDKMVTISELPSREDVINWMKSHDPSLTSAEVEQAADILSESVKQRKKTQSFYGHSNVCFII